MNRYYRFTLLLHNLIKSIRKIEENESSKYSIKREHATIIHCLYSFGPLRSKDLGEYVLMDKGQLSRCNQYLEKEGYISGLSDGLRKYNAKIFLTEKGKEVGKSLDEKINEVLKNSSNGLSDIDRENMYKYLEEVSNNLSELMEV